MGCEAQLVVNPDGGRWWQLRLWADGDGRKWRKLFSIRPDGGRSREKTLQDCSDWMNYVNQKVLQEVKKKN